MSEDKKGSFFEERLEARLREPVPLWHYLPPAAGLCFAAFGILSARPDRIADLTAKSMGPAIVIASAVVAIAALGMLFVKPRRARFAVASSLLMIAAAFMAFVPYRPMLAMEYLNASVHAPKEAAALAERIVSVGRPESDDPSRLDAVLGRYVELGADDRVAVRTLGVSFWPREDVPVEFGPRGQEDGAAAASSIRASRAFMLARNVMWYAPGDSIPLFVVCEYAGGRVPLEAWVQVRGELGPGAFGGTGEFVPTIWADEARPGKIPEEPYLHREY